jgi:16S rRNA U516 pseudouridylate synthase RsuA-like enzyme
LILKGLLILSNDGELTQALTHPSHKIEKLYQVTTENAFEKLHPQSA